MVNTQPESGAESLRVTEKLPPESRSAIKLAWLLGEALVSARRRSVDKGAYRHTTAEPLAEELPIRLRADKLVGILTLADRITGSQLHLALVSIYLDAYVATCSCRLPH